MAELKKTIYDLKLYEQLWVSEISKTVTRVPGGWIYSNYDVVNDKPVVYVTFVSDLPSEQSKSQKREPCECGGRRDVPNTKGGSKSDRMLCPTCKGSGRQDNLKENG